MVMLVVFVPALLGRDPSNGNRYSITREGLHVIVAYCRSKDDQVPPMTRSMITATKEGLKQLLGDSVNDSHRNTVHLPIKEAP